MAHVLIIDDNETIREGVAAVVAKEGHKAFAAGDGESGLKLFKARRIDFAIVDLKMEPLDGLQVLERMKDLDEDATVLMITAFGTIETAVEAMKLGAFDFITKPFKPDVLRAKLAQGLEVARVKQERTRLAAENQLLREEAWPRLPLGSMVGESPAMQSVFATVRKVAPTDSSVLITGESGTGKELVARAVHDLSRRQGASFIRVNCGALAETLLESEMFGHEKGAFTGANRRKLGRFELADGGSIFLDEIGDIGPGLQVKLLRVLQERELERVGGEETLSVDVRVIAASNRDLEQAVAEGRFREDLYYRLHIVPIELPPLRRRLEDIEPLARHFMTKLAERTGRRLGDIDPEAVAVLKRYRWPGNVRELENVIEQALVFAEGEVLRAEDLPSNLGGRAGSGPAPVQSGEGSLQIDTAGRSLPEILDGVERTLVAEAFAAADQVKTEAARLLGIKTSALYYKLDKYGIE